MGQVDPMAITPEQAAVMEAEDRHVRAQVQVYEWMERAEQHQAAADYVASLEERPDGWEQTASTHRIEAARALQFAHAWAEAATVLSTRPTPQRVGLPHGPGIAPHPHPHALPPP
ncbi:hypothetical protein [Streptomyces scabiei]|uniref:hypothetical protein n=1 Tax=Streptomyces scabiei TaxID=1930 RepID=UPI0029B46544|nr:hypothetical protein [Streptomyces scabiei]MDX2802391.1 hypothetical protein [Streptomyces scabiei]